MKLVNLSAYPSRIDEDGFEDAFVFDVWFGDNNAMEKNLRASFTNNTTTIEFADKLEGLAIMIRKYETELTDNKE